MIVEMSEESLLLTIKREHITFHIKNIVYHLSISIFISSFYFGLSKGAFCTAIFPSRPFQMLTSSA